MNTFKTKTNPEYAKKSAKTSLIKSFFGFSAIACVGFFYGWQTFLLLEIIVIFALFLTNKNQNKYGTAFELTFEGDNITFTNLSTNSSYQLTEVPLSVISIKQNKADCDGDFCSFSIKNTSAIFSGVENYTELKK
jgi:hypothetical protein